MYEPNLFEPHTVTHSGDPWTSFEAALKARDNAKGLNLQIIEELSKVYPSGISHEKLALRLGVDSTVSGNNVAKRCSTLASKGVIEKAKATDVNSAGNSVSTWKLVFPPGSKKSKWTP